MVYWLSVFAIRFVRCGWFIGLLDIAFCLSLLGLVLSVGLSLVGLACVAVLVVVVW